MTTNQTPLVDLLRLHAEDLYSDYGHNKSAGLLSQAADEIERLRSNSLALEDEKNDYMDGVGDVLGQDHDGETLWAAAQRVMSECDRLRAELAEVDARLDAAIYESSKDWWYSDRLGRIDWLHAMHVGKSQESDMWVAQIITLRDELIEARKPDCRTCLHYTGTGYCEVIFGKACEEGSRYIPQRRFESGPLRLYEKEWKV